MNAKQYKDVISGAFNYVRTEKPRDTNDAARTFVAALSGRMECFDQKLAAEIFSILNHKPNEAAK